MFAPIVRAASVREPTSASHNSHRTRASACGAAPRPHRYSSCARSCSDTLCAHTPARDLQNALLLWHQTPAEPPTLASSSLAHLAPPRRVRTSNKESERVACLASVSLSTEGSHSR